MGKHSLQNELQCTVLPGETAWLNYKYSLHYFIIAKYSQQNELECIVLPG